MGESEIEKLEAILGYNNSPRSRLLQKQNLSENQKAKLKTFTNFSENP